MKKLLLFVGVLILGMMMSSCILLFDSGSATLRIVNNSSYTIYYVYISPSSSSTWGDDQLGESTIAPGYYYDFTLTPDTYDLKAEASGHVLLATEYSVSFADGETKTWTLSDQ